MENEKRAGHKKLKNMDLRNLQDLDRALKRSVYEIEFQEPPELFRTMEKVDPHRRITVHLYRLPHRITSHKTLLDLSWPSQCQYYLALTEDGIKANWGDGSGSLKRQYHNHFIDMFADDSMMVNETGTMIVVEHKRELISYYYHPEYAFMNIALGINWGQDIVQKLKDLQIPFTRKGGDWLSREKIVLNNRGEEEVVFQNSMEDMISRNIRQKIKENIENYR